VSISNDDIFIDHAYFIKIYHIELDY